MQWHRTGPIGGKTHHHERVAPSLRRERKCAGLRPRYPAGRPDGCSHEERGQFARHGCGCGPAMAEAIASVVGGGLSCLSLTGPLDNVVASNSRARTFSAFAPDNWGLLIG